MSSHYRPVAPSTDRPATDCRFDDAVVERAWKDVSRIPGAVSDRDAHKATVAGVHALFGGVPLSSTTISTFEGLPLETLAECANSAGKQAERHAKDAVQFALQAGRALQAAKDQVAHGRWAAWLGRNWKYSHRSASDFMRLAHFQNSGSAANLNEAESVREALRIMVNDPDTTTRSRIAGVVVVDPDDEVIDVVQPDDELDIESDVDAGVAPESQATIEIPSRPHVSRNSGVNEWYTPPEFIESARLVLGKIRLDPASSAIANKTVQAKQFYTAADDGLSKKWPVGTIWLNPPYSQPLIAKFAERFAIEIERGSTGIVLVNNATETDWFRQILAASSAICFPTSRIRFLDPEGNPGSPLQGQVVLYAGPDPDAFCNAFAKHGPCLRPDK